MIACCYKPLNLNCSLFTHLEAVRRISSLRLAALIITVIVSASIISTTGFWSGRAMLLTWCMVLVLLTNGAVDADCPPELKDLQLKRVWIKYGDPVSKDCNLFIHLTNLSWTGEPEHVSGDELNQTTSSEMDLTRWNKQMVCYLDSRDEQCNITVPIFIYKTPDTVSINTVGHTGPMTEGIQYELQCSIQNVAPVEFLTVKWYKGDTLVSNKTINNSSKTPVTARYQIFPSRDDDGAVYRCEAVLDLGGEGPQPSPTVTSDPLNITVYYKPVIHCAEWSPFINTSLSSYPDHVLGNPPPRVSWFHGQLQVESTAHLNKNDSGEYTFIASNAVGNASCVTNITVLYGPEMKPGQDSVEVYEGKNVSLSCTAEGNPEPEVKWSFKNETKASGRRHTALTISKATSADGGEYMCTVINTLGNQSRTVVLVVKKIPIRVSIISQGHTGLMIEGGRYELQCDIQKITPVEFLTVNWFKGKTLLRNNSFTELTGSPENLTDTLEIFPKKADDGAEYRCEAVLDLGSEEHSLIVTSDDLVVGMKGACPITLHPPKVFVEYGASVQANCSVSKRHLGMGWEASQGKVDMNADVQLITWRVDKLVEWDIKPFCYININFEDQCKLHLQVSIYKTPDTVSINTVGHTGPMIEGRQYELQCSIQNVAPAQFLTVKWYKGETLVTNSFFNSSVIKPEDLTATLEISPSRDDDGAKYRCEAMLDLGREGPQPPPKVSDPLNITVHYGPEIEPGLDSAAVYKGENVSLSCTAEGNPEPEVKWSFQNETKASGGRHTALTISGATSADGGEYMCTATNQIGTQTRKVTVVVEELNWQVMKNVLIVVVVLLIIIIILPVLVWYFKRKRTGKYKVQINGEGIQLQPLYQEIH